MRKRGALLAALLATLLLVTGCGSSSSGSDEVTVQTGSLSKAEFVAKADAICKAARTEFLAKYVRFFEDHESEFTSPDKEKEFLGETIDTLVSPSIEKQIEQISALGAPESYGPEVTSFLKALQVRLDELGEKPDELTATPFPFKKAEDVAVKVGLQGCSESFG